MIPFSASTALSNAPLSLYRNLLLPVRFCLQSLTLSQGCVSCTIEYTKQVLHCFSDALGTINDACFSSTHVQNTLWVTHTKVRYIEIKMLALLVTETIIREKGLGLLANGLPIHHLIHYLIHERLTQSQFLVVLDHCKHWGVWVLGLE